MTISYDTILSELNWKIPVQMYCTSSIKNTGIFFNLELKKRWESSTYCYKDLCRPDQIRLLPVSSPILKYKKKGCFTSIPHTSVIHQPDFCAVPWPFCGYTLFHHLNLPKAGIGAFLFTLSVHAICLDFHSNFNLVNCFIHVHHESVLNIKSPSLPFNYRKF